MNEWNVGSKSRLNAGSEAKNPNGRRYGSMTGEKGDGGGVHNGRGDSAAIGRGEEVNA